MKLFEKVVFTIGMPGKPPIDTLGFPDWGILTERLFEIIAGSREDLLAFILTVNPPCLPARNACWGIFLIIIIRI